MSIGLGLWLPPFAYGGMPIKFIKTFCNRSINVQGVLMELVETGSKSIWTTPLSR